MGPIFLENKYMGPLNYNILLRTSLPIKTKLEYPQAPGGYSLFSVIVHAWRCDDLNIRRDDYEGRTIWYPGGWQ